jgi:large subunit ribosomal protein L21
VYAIVDIGGCQLKVTPNESVRVPRVRGDIGNTIKIENVLLLSDGSAVAVGKPYLEGKSLVAEILRHGKDRKVIVFKKKRRKKYRRRNGHRQQFTEILIKEFPS